MGTFGEEQHKGALDRRSGVHVNDRQPVHVVYGGAHLFKPDTAARLGRNALAAPGSTVQSRAFGRYSRGGGSASFKAAKPNRWRTTGSILKTATGTAPTSRRTRMRCSAARRSVKASSRTRFRHSPVSASSRSRANSGIAGCERSKSSSNPRRPAPGEFRGHAPQDHHRAEPAALAKHLDALDRDLGIAAGSIRWKS